MAWSVPEKYKDICAGSGKSDFKFDSQGSQAFCKDVKPPTSKLFASTDKKYQAAMLYANRWDQHQHLRIKFIDGTTEDQQWVKDVITRTYTADIMNLTLEWLNASDPLPAEIRISFSETGGCWSFLGKECLTAPPDKPTMNLAWLDKPDQTGQLDGGVIKHEFGHCLGPWIHEHQNPKGNPIQWNVPLVISNLRGAPNEWTDSAICENIFPKYAQDQLRGTEYDKDSIMQYFYPDSWVENNQGTRINQNLSVQDRQFLKLSYPPGVKTEKNESPYTAKLTRSYSDANFFIEIISIIGLVGGILAIGTALLIRHR